VLIAPEGLAVAIARSSGHGAIAAGVLSAAIPAGFVIGAWLVLRVAPERRRRLLPGLLALACVPLLLTPVAHRVPMLTTLWVLAGAGGGLQVIANAAFVAAVPAELRGRAYGVASTCLMVVQGGTLLIAGGLAELFGSRAPIAIIAGCVLLTVPLLLEPRGRHVQVPA
jgi:MFS family permease